MVQGSGSLLNSHILAALAMTTYSPKAVGSTHVFTQCSDCTSTAMICRRHELLHSTQPLRSCCAGHGTQHSCLQQRKLACCSESPNARTTHLLTCFVLVLPLLGVFLIRIGVVPLRVSCDLMEVSHSAHKAAFDDADSPNSWIARPAVHSGSWQLCCVRKLRKEAK